MKINEYADFYVNFIVEKDVFKRLPIYHIDRSINGIGDVFKDSLRLLAVNRENEDNSPLGRLMYDFKDDMHYDVLANRVRYFKE